MRETLEIKRHPEESYVDFVTSVISRFERLRFEETSRTTSELGVSRLYKMGTGRIELIIARPGTKITFKGGPSDGCSAIINVDAPNLGGDRYTIPESLEALATPTNSYSTLN